MSSKSLVIREMQPEDVVVKKPGKTNCGEDDKHTGNPQRGCQQAQPLWKTIRSFLTKVIHVSDNPEIPLYT